MKKQLCWIVILALILSPFTAAVAKETKADDKKPASKLELKTEEQKVSYSIGFQIGTSLERGGFDVDMDIVVAAMKEVLAGKEPQMTEEEMRTIMMEFQQKMMQKRQAEQEKAIKENLEKANAFLEENGKKKGVTTLESGLQYKVLEKGKGETPVDGKMVSTHYKGTLIDGTEFDSSYKRDKPFEFMVPGRVIKAWNEAIQLMKVGDKWQLFVPPALGYGERGSGPNIPPNSLLIFEIELLEVKDAPVPTPGAPNPHGGGIPGGKPGGPPPKR
jgi:FKBP-type peptidyl-prolyl cis-trans isomerase FklB